jgi:hypothetical protein
MPDNIVNCRALIWRGFRSRQCTRAAWADGWCRQHHPDTVRKRKQEAARLIETKHGRPVAYVSEVTSEAVTQLQDIREWRAEIEARLARLKGGGHEPS